MRLPLPQASSTNWRSDIDGMRAWAVLAVLLFHAWPELFPAGHLGVDIFFVISGYLITDLLARSISNGKFRFSIFYHRRILRIVPPVVLVLLITLAAGYFLLTAVEYANLAANAQAGAFFGANLFLMAEAGYFDLASSLKPLLHLWSLGIEEQFYIIYPLLLLLAARWSAMAFMAVLIGGVSLLFGPELSEYFFGNGSTAATRYYSPLNRAFALCAGSALALLTEKNRRPPRYAHFFALAGVLLLIASFWLVASAQIWPTRLAILPVAGTLLLIYSGPDNCINRFLLANPWLALLGLCSYELYLWHWPLLAFANILAGGPEHVPHWLKGALLAIALLLAALSFYAWGLPVRRTFRNVKAMSLVFIALLIISGLMAWQIAAKKGLPGRIDSQATLKGWELPSVKADTARAAGYYPDWIRYTDLPNQAALMAAPSELEIALIGDSHAHQLYAGLGEAMGPDIRLGVFPASGQAPFLGIATLTEGLSNYRRNGYRLIQQAYETVLNNPGIQTVILVHNPVFSFHDTIDPQNPIAKLSETQRDDLLVSSMRESITKLVKAGKKVVLILDNPALDFEPQAHEARPVNILQRAAPRGIERAKAEADPIRNWYRNLLQQAASGLKNVYFIDLVEAFCEGEYCLTEKNGQPLYWDRNHLTYAGSRLAGGFIASKLRQLASRQNDRADSYDAEIPAIRTQK